MYSNLGKNGKGPIILLHPRFFLAWTANMLAWKRYFLVLGVSMLDSIMYLSENQILPMHPGKLAWNLKVKPWKRRFLSETFHFQVPCSFLSGSTVGEEKSWHHCQWTPTENGLDSPNATLILYISSVEVIC